MRKISILMESPGKASLLTSFDILKYIKRVKTNKVCFGSVFHTCHGNLLVSLKHVNIHYFAADTSPYIYNNNIVL